MMAVWKKLRRGIRIQWNPILFAAWAIPSGIMLLLFIINSIYPFGDRSFLYSDMYHQYMPFFTEFMEKVKAGEPLYYSWNVGIGSNFLALYVYYLASPLHWLAFLLPQSLLIEFMSYLVILKVGLCGLTFCMYLRKHFQTESVTTVLFAVFYALSGYMAAYNWNIMWLDCVILFPLIIWGLERLVKEGKPVLYCVTLALSILTNFYISIMICIFLVLYFITLLFTEERFLKP
ncbi:MAG: YfhO family protein, partial [Lachnospiraceae bacterium]|nr:YfhO family protein [Lachnospiraceae bacterium]